MRVQRCKGSRDLFPGEMTRFRLIEGVFRDCCLKWGYEEVRTPTLEYLHLFTSTGTLTPGMLGRVYSFLDWDGWSGERVVLRPDGTIPIARLYIDSMEDRTPAKLFYVANVFTFEETGEKTRERWQCGTELIGAGSATADVELLTLALDVLKRLKLENVEVKLSHAGLIRALLTKLGLSPDEQARIFDRLLDGDTEALTGLKPSEPALGRALAPLLDMKGKAPGFLKNLKTVFAGDLPELKPSLNNFIDIVNQLETLDYNYQIDITSGRGFEYYTGLIFQLFIGGKKIGGGGRYDDLIPLMGGSDLPASGFALYLDRLMDMIKPEVLAGTPAQRVLIKTEAETVKEGFNIARRLREAGHVAELQLGEREPANVRWTLDVRSKAPVFVLTDRVNNRKSDISTAEEVIRILGEKGADKNSPA